MSVEKEAPAQRRKEFEALAWEAANAKARELGWIAKTSASDSNLVSKGQCGNPVLKAGFLSLLKLLKSRPIEVRTATKEPVDSGATRAVRPANDGRRSPFFLAPSDGRHNPHTPPGGNCGHACARDIGAMR